MFYSGDPFCVENANIPGRWFYADFSTGDFKNDPPITVERICED